ncbi:MAG: amidohydrolase [Bradymonadaceae bacterium]|nr:amidohydrolase [Lujinxingiaceae bacterium]
MLILHPKIYLAASPTATTDALLIRDGHVLAVGDQARRLGHGEALVEPGGACLFPALADAHIHLWGLGLREDTVNLRGMSPEAIYVALSAASPGPHGWVFGTHWDDNLWPEGETLALGELDRLFADTPVSLRRVDGHALWVNSAALRRANITRESQCGEGGRIDRDASGALSGLLVDHGMDRVLAAIEPPSQDEDLAVFERSARMLRGFGVASAHMAWMQIDRLAMLQAMHGAGTLPLRVYLMIDGEDPGLAGLLAAGPQHDEQAWLSWRAVKFFADGAMGSRGARMLEPYRGGGQGLRIYGAGELAKSSAALMAAGWQVAVHAIGDAAVREVLDAFAGVDGEVRARLRPRLEHAQIVSEQDFARFGELSTIASIQPIHMRSDAPWAARMLHAEQLAGLYAWRKLAAHTGFAGGSDYPIDDPNPWHAIATAISRRDANEQVFAEDQALSRTEALGAYTEGAAFAAHWEQVLGKLEAGFAADVIALDRDPFLEPPESIWNTQVVDMWIAGKRQDL